MNITNRSLILLLIGLFSFPALAADKQSSPPPRATGELSDAERLFQGAWRLGEFTEDSYLGKLQIDGRDFRHDGVHGKHAGYVSIRPERSPAEIDFTIEECGGCDFAGKTSRGIYYREEGIIVFAGPLPGDPRSANFDKQSELWRMRPWDDAAEAEAEARAARGE